MPDNGAQMYTFQLDSEAAEKVNDGHYKVELSPPLELPLLAEPQAMVRSVVFCNSFANVQQTLYKNATVDLEWHPNVSSPSQTATATLTIPDGYYTIAALQLELAKQAYKTANATFAPESTTAAAGPGGKGDMNRLWNYIDTYVTHAPAADAIYQSVNFNDSSVWTLSANGDYILDTHHQFGLIPSDVNLHLYDGQNLGSTLGQKGHRDVLLWRYHCGTSKLSPNFAEGNAITGPGIPSNTTISAIKTYYDTDDKTLYIKVTVSQNLTINTPNYGNYNVQMRSARSGLSVGSLAVPELSRDTTIGEALSFQEVAAIAKATYKDAATVDAAVNVIPDLVIGGKTFSQSDRSVFPFYLQQDPSSGAVQFMSAVPDVKVKSTSTLFTQMLGYDGSIATFEADQDYLVARPGYAQGQPFTATRSGRVTAARAVQIHVPTIVASTYDRKGRLQGNQMAQVPIPLGTQQNEFVSWQATTPYYVPCQMYGSSIDSIEFYLTNENNEPIDLQVSQFSITMTIGWQSPNQPMLGTAEAEDLPQDLKLAYVQSGRGMKHHY